MSRGFGVRDWLRRARDLLPKLQDQSDRFHRAQRAHRDLAERLRQEIPERFEGLLLDLLPDITAASLQRVAKVTGALGGADPQGMVAERRTAIEAEQAEIRSDVEIETAQQRIEGPLEDEITELKRSLGPIRRFLREAKHPRLDRLLDCDYGTPSYSVPWWRLSYYSDWKAGDEILEATGAEFEEFAAFREAFAGRFNQGVISQSKYEARVEEQGVLKRTLSRYRELEQSLTQVEDLVLLELRGTLRAFLQARGEGALEGRIDADRGAKNMALGWVGVGKRLQYVQELERERLTPFGAAIEKSLAKMRRKSVKYARPKKAYTRFSADEIERTFVDRSAKWDKFWTRYDAAFAALNDFDDRYHYGRFEDDFLWWDLFCDGRVKGRFSEEVTEFYEEYEEYSWESPWDDSDGYEWEEGYAAAAVADADGRDEGELWDGS
ncbi:MAG: hypothetical protein JKY65_08090 [Planctomycetes bacterium]|nr:hypothetical protein [Planctomycetota bacterium]